ncbi:hypothetical protein UlMin_033124 [Ulmus minor]
MHTLTLVQPWLGSYLQEIGYERWSRTYLKGRRYNIMTTNIFECINAILSKERELLVTTLAKEMRCLVQRWHYERRTKAEKCKTKLTPSAEALLSEHYQLSLRMCLDPASDTIYTMFDGDKNGVVNLDRRTCSCRHFQLEQLPCAHAMIAIRHRKRDFQLDQLPCEHALVVARRTTYEAYDLCSLYYSKDYWYESYKGVVHPLPHITQWSILEHISAFKLMPPDVRTTIGRRKKRRIPSVGEEPTQAKCN